MDGILLRIKITSISWRSSRKRRKVLTPEQEQHLKRIKANFTSKVDTKYRAGQKEHGGDLMHNNALAVLDMAIAEAVDLVVYLETLREVLVGK